MSPSDTSQAPHRAAMLSWIGRFFDSSIGKKVTMALTGLLLVGFLAMHLAGNLLLLEGPEGEAFGAYAQKLHNLGPLLYVAEAGLIGLFGLHIGFAVRTILENRRARASSGGSVGGSKYAVSSGHGGKTFASASMPITGAIVLFFLIVHILNFRLDGAFKGLFVHGPGGESQYAKAAGVVLEEMASPLIAIIYLVGVGALTVHLSHGIQSAFQTLGANHPKFTPMLRPAGVAIAVLIGLGFASLPLFALLQ